MTICQNPGGLFLMPFILTGSTILFVARPRIVLEAQTEKFRKYYEGFIILFIFIFVVHFIIIFWNIGIKINPI
jgi:uncharacterized membrane protein